MASDVHVEQCVMVCPQCEGEGSYADGLDEAACSTECTRCGSNGWIVDLATRVPATDGVVHTPIEADGKIPVEFYQWLYGIERDVLVWSLTPNEIAALIAALSAIPNREVIEAETLKRAAKVAKQHKPDRKRPLSAYDADDRIEIRAEERGECIAAGIIAAARTAVPELLAEREALVARVAELEGALEPFAEKAAYADALEMEDTDYCECAPILAGQYRAARAALKEQS